MAEGSQRSRHPTNKLLVMLGIDIPTLEAKGIPPALSNRIYRALWVYSRGWHEIMEEVRFRCSQSPEIIGALWKVFSILFEEHQENYLSALASVEQQSQRVLTRVHKDYSNFMATSSDQLIRLKNDYGEVCVELEEAKELIEVLRKQSKDQAAVIDKYAKEMEAKTKALDELTALNSRVGKELHKQQLEFEKLAKNHEKLQENVVETVAGLKIRISNLTTSLSDETVKTEALEREVAIVSSQLELAKTSVDKVRTEKAKLSEERATLNEQLLETAKNEHENKILREKVQSLEEVVKSIRHKRLEESTETSKIRLDLNQALKKGATVDALKSGLPISRF